MSLSFTPIEKPMPPKLTGTASRPSKYTAFLDALQTLEVGKGFRVDEFFNQEKLDDYQGRVYTIAKMLTKKTNGQYRFSTRRLADGKVGIWRIA